jgi:hypothetical protein
MNILPTDDTKDTINAPKTTKRRQISKQTEAPPGLQPGEPSPVEAAKIRRAAREAREAATVPILWLPNPDELALLRAVVNDPDAATNVFTTLKGGEVQNHKAKMLLEASHAVWEVGNTVTPDALARCCHAQSESTEFESVASEWLECAQIALSDLATLPEMPDMAKGALEIAKRLTKSPRFELFTLDDLENIPRSNWLVQGMLVERTVSVISADSGSFKSFLALDLALSIATATPFHGREVKGGPVVYIAAEGFYTMRDRAKAWLQHRQISRPRNFYILSAPVNMADEPTISAFVSGIAALRPSLIVVDTLSQCAIGLNENSNDEMARFVAGMMALGRAAGAHVTAVHHNSKSGGFRGAGAIKANVDAHISLERPENDSTNTVFVRCEKQRGAPFAPFALRGEEVELPYLDEYGAPITSLVFELQGDAPEFDTLHANAKKASAKRDQLLALFDEINAEKNEAGVKAGTWMHRASAICPQSSFWRHLKEIAPENGTGVIFKEGDVYRRNPATLTTLTTLKNQSDSCETIPLIFNSHNSHNPLGVRVVRVESDSAPETTGKTATQNPKTRAKIDSEPYGNPST